MKFIKKNMKIFITIIVTAILFSGISVFATYDYFAKDVGYTKKDGTEISVENALNDLYNKFDTLTLNLQTFNYSDVLTTAEYDIANTDLINKYTYFKFSNISTNEYVKSYALRGTKLLTQSNETLTEDTQYNLKDYQSIWVNLKGNGNDNAAICEYNLIFYN